MAAHIPNHVCNAVRNALYAAHKIHNDKDEKGLRFAVHILGESPEQGYIFKVTVSHPKSDIAVEQLLSGDLTKASAPAMLEVMAREYWRVRDKH